MDDLLYLSLLFRKVYCLMGLAFEGLRGDDGKNPGPKPLLATLFT